ncbi:MAG: hypothetical protein JWM33_4027 [Caulobacteraceae bacterium]|nr:hypothetical protein [Caulobacteraceae bacterium]
MLTPRHIRLAARLSLGFGLILLAVLMLGPFGGLEKRILLGDKQAHFLAFYGLTALSFVAVPNRRRADLCLIILVLGAVLEVVQGMVGRDMDLADLFADLAGVAAVMLPGWLEQARRLARDNEWQSLVYRRRAGDLRRARRFAPAAATAGQAA